MMDDGINRTYSYQMPAGERVNRTFHGVRAPTEGELGRMMADAWRFLEGACRQMGHMKGDVRWLNLARACEKAHQSQLALQQRRTGRRGTLILPEDIPGWQLPE